MDSRGCRRQGEIALTYLGIAVAQERGTDAVDVLRSAREMLDMADDRDALDDLRVLDLSTGWGMYTTKLLADLGADVLKIEPPPGSDQRYRGPYLDGIPGPERSLFYWYHNTNKRGAVLDLDRADDQQRLRALATDADLLVEGHPPGFLAARGLGYEQLRILNPKLIVVSISPFGQTGPYRAFTGDDIVAAAMGGLLYLGGMPDGPPMQPGGAAGAISIMQADVVAAVGVMLALAVRNRTGLGQQVDVSMQEAVAIAEENALGFYSVMKTIRKRLGNQTFSGMGPAIQRCLGGWIAGGGNLTNIDQVRDLLEYDSQSPPGWLTREWWDATERLERNRRVNEVVQEFYDRHDAEELFEIGQARRIRIAPIRNAEQVVADRQFSDRGFWVAVGHPELGRSFSYPGAPYRFSLTPHRIVRRAPTLGEHSGEGWLSQPQSTAPAAGKRYPDKRTLDQRVVTPASGNSERVASILPLDGILVIDFSWQAAAPIATKYLSAFGATVIRLEYSGHPDFLRLTPVPRPPGNNSREASHIFANFNTDKWSFGVNLNRSEGQDLVRRLIAQADVVLDNYGVDPFPKWGMAFDDLVKLNPDLIMVRSSVMGRTGPCSNYSATGNAIAAATGLNLMMGYPEDPPVGPGTAHPDYSSNPHHTTVAILAALHYRERTGLGQYVDLSQAESTAAFWGHALLDATVNGRNLERTGNRSPWAAPHGVYRCAAEDDDDDRWIAIACRDEIHWRGLAGELDPLWLRDGRFDRLENRLTNVAILDELLGERTRGENAGELMIRLQAKGVPAGVVQNHRDMLDRDPQLEDRGFFVWLDHPELGRIPHDGLPFRLSENPWKFRSPAPLLGQHTDDVLRRFLGLEAVEIEALRARGVVE